MKRSELNQVIGCLVTAGEMELANRLKVTAKSGGPIRKKSTKEQIEEINKELAKQFATEIKKEKSLLSRRIAAQKKETASVIEGYSKLAKKYKKLSDLKDLNKYKQDLFEMLDDARNPVWE